MDPEYVVFPAIILKRNKKQPQANLEFRLPLVADSSL